MRLPVGWRRALGDPDLGPIERAVRAERERGRVLPADGDVFAAFEATPFERVRIVLLGQDPYPTAGHAHGLAFSVRPGVPLPASLQNLMKERRDDLGHPLPRHGYLGAWADRGMLLLNTVLTVREGEPGSHAGLGWEAFTDRVLAALNACTDPIVFVLLGGPARKKRALITNRWHPVLEGTHPSPLSANAGFFGSRIFSTVDGLLGRPFDWTLPDEAEAPPEVADRDPALDAVATGLPPREPLRKLLAAAVWVGLTEPERDEVRAAIERVLPRGFRRSGDHYVRDGAAWVLVPGGTADLGLRGKSRMAPALRKRFEAEQGMSPEDWLAPRSTPARTVEVPPVLLMREARSSPPTPAELADGLRLPDGDTWEAAFSPGRAWFPWGHDWPTTPVPPIPHGLVRDPGVLEATDDPFRFRGVRGATGMAADLGWATAAELDLLTEPATLVPARYRLVCPVFPYSRR